MGEGRPGRDWHWIQIACIAAGAIVLVAPMPAVLVERYYASPVYPHWQRVVTPLSNAVPFALFDAWLVALVVVIGAIVTRVWRERGVPRLRRAARIAVRLAAVVSGCYLWFMASWGLNYRRASLEARLDFAHDRVTTAAADDLADRTVAELNRLYPLATARPWPTWRDVPRALEAGLDQAVRGIAGPGRVAPGAPHATLLQPYFRWASIDGMTNPFLLEVLINDDLLPMERHGMVAHEWGHLAGLAHEAEASYFGWRLCRAADPQAQYSGWIAVSGLALSAVPPARRSELLARLEPGPRQDLRAIAARQARAVPAVREAAWLAYDRYLRSNRVAEGVASYDRALILMLGVRETS